jgi:hypothetical protein
MSQLTLAPAPQALAPFLMPALLLVARLAWSAFWFYAASQVDENVRRLARPRGEIRPDLRLRQALGGRFPVPLRGAVAAAPACRWVADRGQARRRRHRAGSAKSWWWRRSTIQIADRGILRAATISAPDGSPRDGELEQGPQQHCRAAAVPQRAAIVFDDAAIDRVNASVQTPLARAKHVELHARLADGSRRIIR